MKIYFLNYLPEDPSFSTPSIGHFYFFSGPNILGTICNHNKFECEFLSKIHYIVQFFGNVIEIFTYLHYIGNFRLKHTDNFKYMVENNTPDIRPRKKTKRLMSGVLFLMTFSHNIPGGGFKVKD